eukprot:TRINITY_DN2243_c0_g1_i2.p1 TRINITY_DN2243_c0_g1~~TRINITY_DN2243_c0_g1_i2.p1  ORF type:complete len:193 (+),score=40.32 TRINITY_DN2243_c0_g1_i2:121-699(+)
MSSSSQHSRSYLIALDSSANSSYAFNELLRIINREEDRVYLVAVQETKIIDFDDIASGALASGMAFGYTPPANLIAPVHPSIAEQTIEKRATELLDAYSGMCKSNNVQHYEATLLKSHHIGEAICNMVEEKKVDYLLVGRRGMSQIKRAFLGSTSRYCLEHASCSVVVVKLPAQTPAHHHDKDDEKREQQKH